MAAADHQGMGEATARGATWGQRMTERVLIFNGQQSKVGCLDLGPAGMKRAEPSSYEAAE
jgi:hypothetical protein